MAHEYKAEAKASHDRKLKSYGAKTSSTADKLNDKDDATNWAGFPALNNNKQAGMAPLNKKASMSEETNPRIMRKKGGRVHGAQSLKRLDKAPRKGKTETTQTGSRIGPIPSPATQSEDFDITTKFNPGEMSEGTMRKRGGKVQDFESRSHESQGAQGKRPFEGHKKGGSCGMKKGGSAYHEGHMNKGEKYGAARTSGETKGELDSAMRALKYGNKAKAEKELGRAQGHTRKTEYYTGRAKGGSAFEGSAKDEREDKKLEKKYGMSHKEWESSDLDKKHDKQENMEGLKKGGRAKRAAGGSLGAFGDYGMGGGDDGSSPKSSRGGKGKTIVNIMVGQPPQGPNAGGPDPMALAAMLNAGGPPAGAGAPPPPAPPPGGAPGGAPVTPIVMPQGGSPMAPPGGASPSGPPMMRKDGGKVQVPYRKPSRKDDYPAMDFGSGGGFGRKQKIDAYGTKGPKGDSV